MQDELVYEYSIDSACASQSTGGMYAVPHVTCSPEMPSTTQYVTPGTSFPLKGKEKEEPEKRTNNPTKNQKEIDTKRKKNTIAARKSRMKKLEQKVALEKAVEKLTTEKEIWKTRALTLRSLLNNNGIPCPRLRRLITIYLYPIFSCRLQSLRRWVLSIPAWFSRVDMIC